VLNLSTEYFSAYDTELDGYLRFLSCISSRNRGLRSRRRLCGDGTEETSVIDDIDRKIIRSLMKEGRISFRDLGQRIHLSPNATAERVRRMQSSGIIRGFGAVVNLRHLGYLLEAYIDVRLQPGTSAENFEAVVTKIPGIVSATIVTGDFDFRIRVACTDQSHLVRVIETLRARAGVQGTSSAIICHEIDVRDGLA
jgi:Lrp/AsnC family leucine-responsive transcriptional regulator